MSSQLLGHAPSSFRVKDFILNTGTEFSITTTTTTAATSMGIYVIATVKPDIFFLALELRNSWSKP